MIYRVLETLDDDSLEIFKFESGWLRAIFYEVYMV
jgi:hypothetical protein